MRPLAHAAPVVPHARSPIQSLSPISLALSVFSVCSCNDAERLTCTDHCESMKHLLAVEAARPLMLQSLQQLKPELVTALQSRHDSVDAEKLIMSIMCDAWEIDDAERHLLAGPFGLETPKPKVEETTFFRSQVPELEAVGTPLQRDDFVKMRGRVCHFRKHVLKRR